MAKDNKGHGSEGKGGGKMKPIGSGNASKEAVAVLGALRGGVSHPRLIAEKAGVDLKTAQGHLEEMHSNGLVDRKHVKGSMHSRFTLPSAARSEGPKKDDADFDAFWKSGQEAYEAQKKGKEPLPEPKAKSKADVKGKGTLGKTGRTDKEYSEFLRSQGGPETMARKRASGITSARSEGPKKDDAKPSAPINKRGDTFVPPKGKR